MVQTEQTTEWLLNGFRYELGSMLDPQTVDYYCGHVRRFVKWTEIVGLPKEAHLITKQHILSLFYHFLQETRIAIGSNGACRKVNRTEDSRWPYYRSLKRFFGWCVKEGYLSHSPMDGIKIKSPKDRPMTYRA